jgi:hypothetical protein
MSQAAFDNGYWYTSELQAFARTLGLRSTSRLRKDELERAIHHFLATGEAIGPARRLAPKSATRDVDRGLAPDLEVVNYTSNRETKTYAAWAASR